MYRSELFLPIGAGDPYGSLPTQDILWFYYLFALFCPRIWGQKLPSISETSETQTINRTICSNASPEQKQSKSTNEHPLSFCPQMQTKLLGNKNCKDDRLEIGWSTEGHPRGNEQWRPTLLNPAELPCSTVLPYGSRREIRKDYNQTAETKAIFFFYNNSPFVTPTKQHLHRSCCNPDMKRYWSMHWSELWISQPSTRHSQKKPKKGLQKKMMQKSDARHGDFSHCIHRDVFFQSSRATAM